jgi:hypothetical protein
MHEEIDRAELLLGGGEEFLDIFVLADVAWIKPFLTEPALLHRLANAALHLFHRQIPEATLGSLLDRVVGNVPRDAAIVGDVEN